MPPRSQPTENETPPTKKPSGTLKVSFNEGATDRDPVFIQEFVMDLHDLRASTDQNGTVTIFISGKTG